MADVESSKPQSLARDYLLEEQVQQAQEAAKTEDPEVKPSVEVAEDIVQNTEEAPGVADSEDAPAAVEKAVEATDSDAGESKDSTPDESTDNANPASSEESNDSAASENTVAEEAEETPQIKLETAPADYRFPTTNQTRHCFTRYIEYHRCVAAKGEGASECEKFAKYYRSLCPSEWVERWNEQRENGTFPGPL